MRAFGAFFERSFDRTDLPLNAANAVQELFLVANDVCQLDGSSFDDNIPR
jgi:hypothetical protein